MRAHRPEPDLRGNDQPAKRSPAAMSPIGLAGAIGNAQLARLLKAGPPAGTPRGASPATATLIRAASTGGHRLSRCRSGGKAGCACSACSDDGLEEELDLRR